MALINGGVTDWTVDHNAVVNSGPGHGGGQPDYSYITANYGSMMLGTIIDATGGASYSGVGFTSYSGVGADYTNWKLTSGASWHNAASDGKDPGVDMPALTAALTGSATTFSPRLFSGARVSGAFRPKIARQAGVIQPLRGQEKTAQAPQRGPG